MAPPVLISCHGISKAYGTHNLFSDLSCGFFADERLGLIGPNGSGKSTLLRILAGLEEPDSGEVSKRRGLHVVYLPQEDALDPGQTVEAAVFDPLPEAVRHAEAQTLRDTIHQMGFSNLAQKVEALSGGWRKRLAIVRAFLQRPDLLLMDEPTNHLDLEAILWLEAELKKAPFAFVLVSHDRYFLENIANRILELHRGYPDGHLKVEGNYSTFIERREEFFNEQARRERVLSNKVRREIEWLRRGPKARTTKAQFRIDAAHQLIDELETVKTLNAQNRTAQIDFDATYRKTKKLLEARDLKMTRGGRVLFEGLNLKLSPGMCLGILGRNGSGKSTLLHVLRGDLAPEAGSVTTADGVRIVTFDQRREQLDPNQTLRRALAPAGDTVIFQDRPVHVASWAKRFLFSGEKLALPVSRLSGGEQARVLIANLMLQPADILLLDEPTNDLDIPTLEVLEDSLRDFPGAVVLITHDRFLMDRLSDVVLALDGGGKAEFFADCDQWLESRKARLAEAAAAEPPAAAPPAKPGKAPDKPRKIRYEEKKELGRIEGKIEKAEEALEALRQRLHDPAIMSDAEQVAELYAQVQEEEGRVEQLYQRWEELEALSQNG